MALTISRVTTTPEGNNTAETAWTLTDIGGSFAVDDFIIVMISAANAGSAGSTLNISSVTDSKGNTYIKRSNTLFDNGAASAGTEEAIFTCLVTNALVSTDDLTVNFGVSTTAKCLTVYKIANDGTLRAAYAATGAHGGQTTGAPALTSGTVTDGDTIFYHISVEGNTTPTGDSDTTNGTWSTVVKTAGGTGTTTGAQMDVSQYKTVTATATQTWNPTFTSADTKAAWITITPENIPAQGGDPVTHGILVNQSVQRSAVW